MKQKVYLETTVPSYLAARPTRDLIVAAHQEITREWWLKRRNSFDLFISPLVIVEASDGDPGAARERISILEGISELAVTANADVLTRLLLARGAVPPQFTNDAAHIAIATVHHMDFLLTWNCKHLANAARLRKLMAVCSEAGYVCPVICTPEELLEL